MYAYARVFGPFHLYARTGSQEVEKLQGAWIQCCDVVDENSVRGRFTRNCDSVRTEQDSFSSIDAQEIIWDVV